MLGKGLLVTILLLITACSQPDIRPSPTPAVLDPSPSPTEVPTAVTTPTATTSPFTQARLEMVERQIQSRGVLDPAVLEAMSTVPRHLFVPADYLDQAYGDHPLPIGFGQTISQPYIVALMTEALKLEPGERVLEIGTGSGYQAAVLAEMGMSVYSIEIIPELTNSSQEQLQDAGYSGVEVRQGDGYFGWPDQAPFKAIIVTAAPDHLPQPLVEQLAEGGRLVIPIGPIGAVQTLWLFEKFEGELQATNLGSVRFVPFRGGFLPEQ